MAVDVFNIFLHIHKDYSSNIDIIASYTRDCTLLCAVVHVVQPLSTL